MVASLPSSKGARQDQGASQELLHVRQKSAPALCFCQVAKRTSISSALPGLRSSCTIYRELVKTVIAGGASTQLEVGGNARGQTQMAVQQKTWAQVRR